MHRQVLSVVLVVLLGWSSVAFPAVITKYLIGSIASLLTTELNALAANAYTAAGPVYNNVVGGGAGDGYTLCDIEFKGTFVANPTAGGAIIVWLLTAPDGTNYEDTPTASVGLSRGPDVVLPVTTGQTGTRVTRRITCPWGLMKAVAHNSGTGQALTASGHTLKIRPVTLEGI